MRLTLIWVLGCMLPASLAACQRRSASEGVIVRQVLHGADVPLDAVPEASGPKAAQPGQVATTLVADTPQAAYKKAADSARRSLESTGQRQALSRLENQIEQEQESSP